MLTRSESGYRSPRARDGEIELRQLFGLENFGGPGQRPKQLVSLVK
jgi:hypothetical protein